MANLDTTRPRWWAPGDQIPPIQVYNSLSRRKVEFKTNEEGKVSWYACGPTVYDDSHLGHARNYVSTDIIRRILKDYFKFDVRFVMNITDVDDKIILRGRQQYLLSKYKKQNQSQPSAVRQFAVEALEKYVSKRLPLIKSNVTSSNIGDLVQQNYAWLEGGPGRPTNVPIGSDEDAKLKMHVRTVLKASETMNKYAKEWDEVMFYSGVEDILLPLLDDLEGTKIDASDHSIFTELTVLYENRFMQDMRDLNVLDPDELTRVTEYGQNIIDYVSQIEKNGFAYKTEDGSVYFDISSFEKKGNQYAKLRPENRGDKALQADGEGALSKATTKKRSEADFALWKASKPGEPAWNSPWGKGRPGWHIECSAMATDKLGRQMDIHSGGIDLAFPHHDNELAQSEAFLRNESNDHEHTWVNYFLHMGHLSIQGAKMSKSLKNFTTIRNALAQRQWTSRSLRIVFLLGNWKEGIEITDDMVQAGITWEEKVTNFFLNAIDLAQSQSRSGSEVQADKVIMAALKSTIQKTEMALADSFDTSKVMTEISNLITVFNSTDKTSISSQSAESVTRWVTSIVNMFGLNGKATTSSSELGWSGVAIDEETRKVVRPLSEYRDLLRRNARNAATFTADDTKPSPKLEEALRQHGNDHGLTQVITEFTEKVSQAASFDDKLLKSRILGLCDELRDVHLWKNGIYLEDRDKEQLPALVRPVTAQMREEKAKQGAERAKKDQEKAAAKAKKDAEDAAKLAKGKLSPQDMFKTGEYSAWDDNGIPTKDSSGDEITKSKAKKLKKDWDAQKKLHEKWQASQG